MIESYPVIKIILDELKTKTLYGKFAKTTFLIRVPANENTNLVTFIFIIRIFFLKNGRESNSKIKCIMQYQLDELENEIMRSEIINGFDSVISESIRQLALKREFDSMCIVVYKGENVGEFEYPDDGAID